jgi:hypothetical protein
VAEGGRRQPKLRCRRIDARQPRGALEGMHGA